MRFSSCLTIFVLLVADTLAAGQSTGAKLNGIVIANEEGGPPLGNISLSAGDDAVPTASDPVKGTFTFVFPKMKPGQAVQIDVKAEGYAVVNDVQLQIHLPDDPNLRSNKLTVILCKTAALQEMRSRLYLRTSIQEIKAVYAQQIKDLEDRHLADKEAIDRLSKERDQAIALATKTADEFAKQDIDKASDLYRQAMQLFLAGKVQEAIRLLDEEKLNRQLEAANQQEAAVKASKEQIKQEWLLKGRLLTLQFRFDDAERAYKTAIVARDDFESNFEYAYFSQSLNQFRRAEEGYKRCLELARKEGDDAGQASTLNNLGNLDDDQNRKDDARQHFEEALKTFKELALKNPDVYLPALAETLNNLGNLDSEQDRKDDARQHYEEALKIRKELALKNPDVYLPAVAMTLNNLGLLDSGQNRKDDARQHYEEALKTFKELALKNPDVYLPAVAMTLNNLGGLDSDQNRNDDARQHFEEALKTFKELALKNPAVDLPAVAETLNNLGNLDSDQNRNDDARQHFEEALKTYTELALKNPDVYLPGVARTLNNLGVLDSDQNRKDDAHQHLEEALAINRKLRPSTTQNTPDFPSANSDSICLSEVLISTQQPYDPAQVADAQHKADSAREAIRQGAKFEDIAKKYSDGPTAADGGALGTYKRGRLAKSIEDKVFAMEVGDVSDVIRTKQGFIVLQVTCK